MNIIRHKNIFFIISSILVIASIVLIAVKGIPQSIEFKGGALLEVLYMDTTPTLEDVRVAVEKLELGNTIIQPTGDAGYIIKSRDLSEEEREMLLQALSLENTYPVETKTFTSIGPSVGKELKKKAIISIILVVFSIILFVAYAFRKVSQPVSSWKFGVAAVLSLVHDVLITTGAFAVFGLIFGAEMDVLFIVALLTVLGVSVNDTIVVFDRVRENIEHNVKEKLNKTFETVVGESISQTMARSINTSLTVVLVLLALYFFGPATTKIFALTMTVGMLIGTFSSIFLASPLLVVWQETQDKKIKK